MRASASCHTDTCVRQRDPLPSAPALGSRRLFCPELITAVEPREPAATGHPAASQRSLRLQFPESIAVLSGVNFSLRSPSRPTSELCGRGQRSCPMSTSAGRGGGEARPMSASQGADARGGCWGGGRGSVTEPRPLGRGSPAPCPARPRLAPSPGGRRPCFHAPGGRRTPDPPRPWPLA